MKGEFVTRIGGSADGAKGCKKYVEGGEMFKRELGFFRWDAREGFTFVEATLLEPDESMSP